jgi:hypothetical protein
MRDQGAQAPFFFFRIYLGPGLQPGFPDLIRFRRALASQIDAYILTSPKVTNIKAQGGGGAGTLGTAAVEDRSLKGSNFCRG